MYSHNLTFPCIPASYTLPTVYHFFPCPPLLPPFLSHSTSLSLLLLLPLLPPISHPLLPHPPSTGDLPSSSLSLLSSPSLSSSHSNTLCSASVSSPATSCRMEMDLLVEWNQDNSIPNYEQPHKTQSLMPSRHTKCASNIPHNSYDFKSETP